MRSFASAVRRSALVAAGVALWATMPVATGAEAGGGNDAGPRTITFERAAAIALERNLSLLLAERRNTLDDAAVSDARARFLPDLRLGVSGNESYDRTDTGGGTEWTSSRSMGVSLSSGLTLFDGFANVSGLREARFEQVAGRLDTERARQTVVFQVITDYLALIEATEQERVRTGNLAAQEEQLGRVRALVEEGERPISDLYQQRATVSSAKLAVVEAHRTWELSRVDLMQTLHLDPLADVTFVIPDAAELDPGEPAGAAAPLIEAADRERPDLAAERQRLAAVDERLTQARAGRWPTLSLSGSFSGRYSDGEPDGVWDQLGRRQSGGVGLSLSLPLFDRFDTRNAIRRAETNRETATINLDALRQDVALQVRRAVLDRDAARESLAAARDGAAAAREALSYTNERYLAGAATLAEVTLSRAGLVSAESAEVSALYRLLWQNRLVDYYIGTLDPDARIGG